MILKFLLLLSLILFSVLAAESRTFTCESKDGKRQYCPTEARQGVRLVRQIGKSPCRRGKTWDYTGNAVWVDGGCEAEFRPADDPSYSTQTPPGSGRNYVCGSDDGKRHRCFAETRYGVRLVKQISQTVCQKDYSWGYTQSYIWVDHGCRAEFGREH